VRDQNARSTLLSKDALRGGHIFFKGRLRLLDDAYVIATLDKNVENAFPARTICPSAMNQNDVLHRTVLRLDGYSAKHGQQRDGG
jgi:hypothetical protein